MCGIAGLAGDVIDVPQAVSRAAHAAAALHHRGPDGHGIWASPHRDVVLAHRRLAIQHLAPEGGCPMVLPDGPHALTFNGEIYNVAALRRELERHNQRCFTTGDTEVLLRACATWGVEATLPRLDGMFAFAFYDGVTRALWLARDRFGEKPLYYTRNGAELAFASEVRALRRLVDEPLDLDHEAIAHYLSRLTLPGDASIYRSISQVAPGGWLRLELGAPAAAAVRTGVYWDAQAAARAGRATPHTGTLDDATDELEATLTATVATRAVSDAPLGVLLSGGIDSTLMAAAMARSAGTVHTFTAAFSDAAYDESPFATRIAEQLGTEHQTLVLDEKQALAYIPTMAADLDEPFADSSFVGVRLLSTLCKQHATVVLSGDGGDELFAGYRRYFLAARAWRGLSLVPARGRTTLSAAIGRRSPADYDRVARLLSIGPGRMLDAHLGNHMHKIATTLTAASPAELYQRLTSPGVAAALAAAPPSARPFPTGLALAEQMMLADTVGYLPEDILTKVDRASMAASLECRAPFLSPELYRFAWSLPLSFKTRRGTGKLVLRNLLQRWLPPALWERPKTGFGVPIETWLRGPLRAWAEDLLGRQDLEAEGLLLAGAVQGLWQRHLSGRHNEHHALWAVLMYQAWRDTTTAGAASPDHADRSVPQSYVLLDDTARLVTVPRTR